MPVRLTARGWGVFATGVVMLAAGLWARYPGVAGFGAALLAMVVVSVGGAALPAPLTVRRMVPQARVSRLTPCQAGLSLTNRSPWLPVRIDGEDLVAGRPLPVEVPVLAAGATERIDIDVPTHRRGIVEMGPLTLLRRGLARLAVARSGFGDRATVTVLPRVLPVVGLPRGIQRSHVGADERVEHGGTDLVGLHEYVPGDDLRRLHWASSARTGTLMIRDDADPSRPHLTVLLDDRLSSYSGDGFEEAADVAASLVAAAAAGGHPGRLVTLSGALDVELPGETSVDSDGGAAAVAVTGPVLDGLAALEPTDRDETAAAATALHGSDIVAVISGEFAPTASLLVDAGRSAFGVLALIDPHGDRFSEMVAGVVVLRGPRADDIVDGWNLAVIR
ncbi:DUF58 domain-containing protein [Phytoactinopolyspora limicola]|uniref:DUF58 domain-containing protein n=1 Tax=Phytoactinopolyspora limicola TaxID=2715536 RepID=UPI001FEA7904|nr:DUF58 domain-containing protein [Phytoactinopolyspora limicola]